MAFITKQDLLTSILLEELDEITRNDQTVIDMAISAAEGQMKAYLNDSYDTDVIFSALGATRHSLLVQYCADITIWFLVARLQAGQYTEDRKARHDRAVKWLKMVMDNQNYPDLPRREQTIQTHIHHGSNPKRGNYY